MRALLFSLLLLHFTDRAWAGNKNKTINIVGTWKEAHRFSLNKEKLDFKDTTYYNFIDATQYIVHHQDGFQYHNTYSLSPGLLDLGMNAYSVVEISQNKMLLKDDQGTYEFVRYKEVVAATENTTQASSSQRGYKEELGATTIKMEQLVGKWEVYKRSSLDKLPEIDYRKILKSLEIRIVSGNLSGTISAMEDDPAGAWKITGYENAMITASGKSELHIQVLKCDQGEMVLQSGSMQYFLKQFK